jgi:hypothetical protein
MLRASLGKVVHTVKRAGTYAAKVPPQELHKIAVHVRAVACGKGRVLPFPCSKITVLRYTFTDKHYLSVCSFNLASAVTKETRLKK